MDYDDCERKWHDLQQEELDRKLQWLNEAPAAEPSAAGQPGPFGQGKKRLQELVRAARPPSSLLYCLGALCRGKQLTRVLLIAPLIVHVNTRLVWGKQHFRSELA